jgi:hypothetical protein
LQPMAPPPALAVKLDLDTTPDSLTYLPSRKRTLHSAAPQSQLNMLADAATASNCNAKARKVVGNDGHTHVSREGSDVNACAESVLPGNLEDAHGMIQMLTQSLRRADQAVVCLGCSTEPRNALLLPCAHLLLCIACAGHITDCPECEAPVKERMHVTTSALGHSPTLPLFAGSRN